MVCQICVNWPCDWKSHSKHCVGKFQIDIWEIHWNTQHGIYTYWTPAGSQLMSSVHLRWKSNSGTLAWVSSTQIFYICCTSGTGCLILSHSVCANRALGIKIDQTAFNHKRSSFYQALLWYVIALIKALVVLRRIPGFDFRGFGDFFPIKFGQRVTFLSQNF